MKTCEFNLKKIADTLHEQCPFILFATMNGLDEAGRPGWLKNPEVSVFVTPGTGLWLALEKILPLLAGAAPGVFIDVTLLNRVDAVTRYRATQGVALFIREGSQETYANFVRQAGLDHRILRARGRRLGLIDNC